MAKIDITKACTATSTKETFSVMDDTVLLEIACHCREDIHRHIEDLRALRIGDFQLQGEIEATLKEISRLRTLDADTEKLISFLKG